MMISKNKDIFSGGGIWWEPEPNTGCWLWLHSVNNWGYGTVHWNGHQKRAHRMAWEQANGSIPEGMCVCHKCDQPSCVNPAHLFLGTQADNVADKVAKGRVWTGTGVKQWKSKLTPEIVRYIRDKNPDGLAGKTALAEELGVSFYTVYNVLAGRTWKQVVCQGGRKMSKPTRPGFLHQSINQPDWDWYHRAHKYMDYLESENAELWWAARRWCWQARDNMKSRRDWADLAEESVDDLTQAVELLRLVRYYAMQEEVIPVSLDLDIGIFLSKTEEK